MSEWVGGWMRVEGVVWFLLTLFPHPRAGFQCPEYQTDVHESPPAPSRSQNQHYATHARLANARHKQSTSAAWRLPARLGPASRYQCHTPTRAGTGGQGWAGRTLDSPHVARLRPMKAPGLQHRAETPQPFECVCASHHITTRPRQLMNI